ncbi:MAG TPA: flagellar basal-body MS-ring/collar protein FliF [Burkholderiales bacterium]|jgi:flagellar M-ring protein FliF
MADTAALPQTAFAAPALATPGFVANWRAMPGRTKIGAMIGVALSIAMLVAAWMWSQAPDYKVLFTGIPDKDGGAIIASLTQMNVPYKLGEGGGTIMVPAPLVHETRLKLASQGLPKGGTVGFELIDNQKFGATQFQEQVNYQRALEGELAKSIQSLGAVQGARVHLAIPKPTLFMREQQKPTASVLVSLYPGKTLDRSQVAGIMHLVSSSLPDLPVKNVSVVDQNGNLLSPQTDGSPADRLDATQLTYVQQLEQANVKRILDILTPIYGAENVRAQVTADIDFSQSESTSEAFKPNQNPADAAVRSQQISESSTPNGSGGPQGVPGALSNQPTPNATATLNNGTTNPGAAGAAGAAASANSATRKESVTNYEVDKTVRRTTTPTGALKRLSAAVVINNKKVPPAKPGGNPTNVPLSADEVTQANNLVKEAIGFSKDRGDSINVVNAAFTAPTIEVLPDVPIWKQPEAVGTAKEFGRYLVLAGIAAFMLFGVFRPIMRQLVPPKAEESEDDEAGTEGQNADGSLALPAPGAQLALPGALDRARDLAKKDPRIVANVVRNWVNKDE